MSRLCALDAALCLKILSLYVSDVLESKVKMCLFTYFFNSISHSFNKTF